MAKKEFSKDHLDQIRNWSTKYIDTGKLPCGIIAIMRGGELVFLDVRGYLDVERGILIKENSLFRIYSMTKIITSVAALMLYEEGHFQLDDPLYDYIPAFQDMHVFTGGTAENTQTVPAKSPITIRQVMTHTAGFTYSFNNPDDPIEAIYKAKGLDFNPNGSELSDWVKELASVPLIFHPGTQWNYSVATDVLGHLVEVLSGQNLGMFLLDHILNPLAMNDTSFSIDESDLEKFTTLYKYNANESMSVVETAKHSEFRGFTSRYQGGAGLISTASDYLRFLEMMRKGGELDGIRLLQSKTIDLMTKNHLPGDLASMGQPRFGESNFEGVGFGLGVAIMINPEEAQIASSIGEYNWGGAASTACWVDPTEELSVVYMTQLYPSDSYPLRRQLRSLVYQALMT